MSLQPEPIDHRGLATLVARLTEGLGRLMLQHIELAKLEITDGLKAIGGDVGQIAAAVPLLIIGYCFICSGVAVVVSRWIGVAGGLFAVGGFHLLVGGVIAALSAMRLSKRQMLSGSSEELQHTAALFKRDDEPAPKEIRDGQR